MGVNWSGTWKALGTCSDLSSRTFKIILPSNWARDSFRFDRLIFGSTNHQYGQFSMYETLVDPWTDWCWSCEWSGSNWFCEHCHSTSRAKEKHFSKDADWFTLSTNRKTAPNLKAHLIVWRHLFSITSGFFGT